MLALGLGLSTPLVAQTQWSVGFAGTLGGGWQIEGAEFGAVRRLAAGPLRFGSLSVRLGSFVDEGAIIGGTRGLMAGVSLGARSGLAKLADVGTENSPSAFGVDLTVEATGYLGTRSPLPEGSPWAALSVLPGLRFGDADGVHYALLIGPSIFFGRTSDVHALLGLRFELPLAHREQ
jgi:hypothetical protein